MRARLLLSLLFVAACGGASTPATTTPHFADRPHANEPITVSPAAQAAVDAPDRDADDRALDAGRHPAEVLSFFHVAPGQHVAELFAGPGYSAELLARIVGDGGVVYGQNTTAIMERFARAPWMARMQKPVMAHVVTVERDMGDPLPPEAHDLDFVFMNLVYHDTVWMNVDRAAMNRNIFAALKSGGVYGVVDHSAVPGTGTRDATSLHRIDEQTVIDEVTAAGFRLDGESDVLRNPSDARDWSTSPRTAGERRGTSDRFVLRFVKE